MANFSRVWNSALRRNWISANTPFTDFTPEAQLLRTLTHGKKKKIPEKYQRWIDVRKRYHLSHAHIQMARELGMNPKKFGSLANNKQEPWKLPLPGLLRSSISNISRKISPIMCDQLSRWSATITRKKKSAETGN
ncbi:hypothetical protein ES708_25621 [subsurface metagenome]